MKNIPTFEELALLWETDKKAFVKRSTFSIYSLHLHKHLIPAFGPLTSLSETEVQAFVNTKLCQGMKAKTVKDLLMILNMVLRFGARYRSWKHRPMDIRFPSTCARKARLHVLSLSQQKKLLAYLSMNFNYYNLGLILCLSTGMRIGELCALTWADIDLKAGVVHVTKTLQRVYLGAHHSEVMVDTPKTENSYRDIPLSADMVAWIRPLKKKATPRHYVLTNAERPTEPGNYRSYFKRLMENLGLPPIHFHGLRHSFATRCIECNCDYKTVSAILGHSNVNTTLNLYVHPGFDLKKKCVTKAFRQLQ